MPDLLKTVCQLAIDHPLVSVGAVLAAILYARLMAAGPGGG